MSNPQPHRFCRIVLATFLVLFAARAQDPSLKETFQQAKALWATQGDRDGASAKFEQVISLLEPKAKSMDGEWLQILCETYNWMAVLDDRVPAKRPKASKELESILDLNPDFDIDRNITNSRLQGVFDALRGSKLCKVKLVLNPEGGSLILDGKARPSAPFKYMTPGSHTIAYGKPGFQLLEQHVDLSPKDAKALEFTLTRISSTLTFHTFPSGAEILLDGKSLGFTTGQAPPELRPMAEKIGLSAEQLSSGFVASELAAGKHILEVRAPCYKSRRIELGEDFSTPFADHMLEPLKLEPSRGFLTVGTAVPGAELLLGGKSYGSLPVKDLQVCSGSYDLQVKFPSGGFTQRIEVVEGKSLSLQVKPKPRMTYLGFDGSEEFAGRERLLKMLESFGERLTNIAYIQPLKGESAQDALLRLKGSKDTELVLQARPVPGRPIHHAELIISTLTGEEERILVKPLEEDPLASFAAKLNTQTTIWEPWTGLTLLDVHGEAGPWVLQVDSAAEKSGMKVHKPVTAVNGKSVNTVQAFRRLLSETQGDRITITQGDSNCQVSILPQPLEIPVNASNLCYPFLLADLRLRYLSAKGDEAGILRLEQALALMHFHQFDKAMEVLRDAKVSGTRGVCQGTIDYYTGVCLLRLGDVYVPEAIQAFNKAMKYPQATLFGPEGPLVTILAKQALDDLKP